MPQRHRQLRPCRRAAASARQKKSSSLLAPVSLQRVIEKTRRRQFHSFRFTNEFSIPNQRRSRMARGVNVGSPRRQSVRRGAREGGAILRGATRRPHKWETHRSAEPIQDVACVTLHGSVVEVESKRGLGQERMDKYPLSSSSASATVNRQRRRLSEVFDYSSGGDSVCH